MVVQWLRFCAPNAVGPGLIPGQGTRSHMPQQRSYVLQLNAVQFGYSIVSNFLWRHGLQHTRPRCPSPTPRVYANSCPLNRWCHPTISSSVMPFSRLQSFPASGSSQMDQFFTSGGQRIGVSAPASVLPMNMQDWFPLGWTGWLHSLLSNPYLN